MTENSLEKLAQNVEGTIREVGRLPDGSGYAMMDLPLPKDYWFVQEGFNVPPMPFRCGTNDEQLRKELTRKIQRAARYAIRASTDNGKEKDFSPDAMVQNFVVGLLGYNTPDGLSKDKFANPDPAPENLARRIAKAVRKERKS